MGIPAPASRMIRDPVPENSGAITRRATRQAQKFVLMEVIGEEGALIYRRPIDSPCKIKGHPEEFDARLTQGLHMARGGKERSVRAGKRERRRPTRFPGSCEAEDRMMHLCSRLRWPEVGQRAQHGRKPGDHGDAASKPTHSVSLESFRAKRVEASDSLTPSSSRSAIARA